MEDNINALLTQIQAINLKLDIIDPMSRQVNSMTSDVAELGNKFENVASLVQNIQRESQSVRRDVSNVREEVGLALRKIQYLETDMKRGNVVLYNFSPQHRGRSLLEDVVSALNAGIPNLNLRLFDVRDAFRLKSSMSVRPVVIKFASVAGRDYVLKSGFLLRRLGLSISPDYTERELIARKKLKETLEDAKTEGFVDVKLRGLKLFIGNQVFMYNYTSGLVEEQKRNTAHDSVNPPSRNQAEPPPSQNSAHSAPPPVTGMVGREIYSNMPPEDDGSLAYPSNARTRSESSATVVSFSSATSGMGDEDRNLVMSLTETPAAGGSQAIPALKQRNPAKRSNAEIISPDNNEPMRVNRPRPAEYSVRVNSGDDDAKRAIVPKKLFRPRQQEPTMGNEAV